MTPPTTYELHQGDFFLTWPHITDRSVDLAVVDPPYGVLKSVHDWDKEIDFGVLAWILNQLMTPHGQLAVFSSGVMLTEVIGELGRKYFDFRYTEIWQKPNIRVFHKDRPKPDVEFVSVFHRRGLPQKNRIFNWVEVAPCGAPYTRINHNRADTNSKTLKRKIDASESGLRFPSSVVHFPNRPAMTMEEKRYAKHPTQKSLEHIERIIRLLSYEGQTVLDPFMGSGTTILAAARTGRRGIGFEIEEEFFRMTELRLEHKTSKGQVA